MAKIDSATTLTMPALMPIKRYRAMIRTRKATCARYTTE